MDTLALSDAAVALLQDVLRSADVPWVFFNAATARPLSSIASTAKMRHFLQM
jgi:hypothetical protein